MGNATTALETDLEHLPRDTRVGEYLIEQPIGVGGFARVYQARHPVLASRVAVKIITRALALDPEAIQRFVLEAQAASRITHPGVVRILDYGKLPDGRAYQVMELIEGPALDQHLEQVGRLPLHESLRLLAEIAAALDAAHAAGIIHRDLKPANVLLAPAAEGPSARLADFGIAKALETEGATPHLTRTGTTLGTPAYMSPEQALGRAVGKASDIYAFGVVAFELVTGRVPFAGDTPFETMMMHVQTPAPMPSAVCAELGPRFDAAMTVLLAKHPDERPTSLAAAMAMLREEVVASPPAPGPRRALVAGLAVVALAVGISYVMWPHDELTDKAPVLAAPPVLKPESSEPGAAAVDEAAPSGDGGVAAPVEDPPPPVKRAGPKPRARASDPPRSARPADQLESPPDYEP